MAYVGLNGPGTYEENTNGLGGTLNPYERYLTQFAPQHAVTQENNHLFNRFGVISLMNDDDEVVDSRHSNSYETRTPRSNEEYSQQNLHQGNHYSANFMDRFGGGFDFNFNLMDRGLPQMSQQPQSGRTSHYPQTHYPQQYNVQYLPESLFQQHQTDQLQHPQQQWGTSHIPRQQNTNTQNFRQQTELPDQLSHTDQLGVDEILETEAYPQQQPFLTQQKLQQKQIQQLQQQQLQQLQHMQLQHQQIQHQTMHPQLVQQSIQSKQSTESKSELSKETPKVKLSWAEFHSLAKPAGSPTLVPPVVEPPTPVDSAVVSGNLSNSSSTASSKASTPVPVPIEEVNNQGQDAQVSRTLWVGNIGPDVTEQELFDEFSNFGDLESVRILHDRFCAFVNFVDEEQATAAKKAMHGQIIGSQYIVVNYRQTKQGEEAQETSSYAPPSRALYIGNLAETVTDKDLKKECEKYGEIESIRILHKKGCAFVNYIAVKNATAALHGLQGRRLNDQVIKVNYGKAVPIKGREDSTSSSSTVPNKVPRQAGRGTTSPNQTPPLLNAWTNTNINPNRPAVASPAPSPALQWSGISAIKENPLTASQELGAQNWLAENGLDICEVCYTNFRNTLFIPCYHTCCGECMAKLRASAVYTADRGSRCPFCKEVIKQYVAISSPLTTPPNTQAYSNTNSTTSINKSIKYK